MLSPELILIVRATGEIYGKAVSDAAAMMFLSDLSRFETEAIKVALRRCRQELKTFPSVADVVARIDDGRPGVEEAWAMLPKSEDDSVVWTDEMSRAYGVCRSLIAAGDMVGARMSFKEHYSRLVADAKMEGRPPRWVPSLGHDPGHRSSAIQAAVDAGRITQADADRLSLPAPEEPASSDAPVKIAEILKKLEPLP